MSDSFIRLEVPSGSSLARDFQIVDSQGQNRTSVYLSTDTFAGLIWPAGSTRASATSITPAAAWISGSTGATAGQWRFELHESDTTSLGAGSFRVLVTLARGSDKETLLDAYLEIGAVGGSFTPVAASAVTDETGTALGLLSTLYCTDENIAVRCGADFTALLTSSQVLASGSDGAFSSSDPWTLTSASNNFDTQGVAVGCVVWLRKPATAFPAGGLLMAVGAVNGTSLTLRRLGLAKGLGQSPVASGGQSGVDFQIATFQPQIEEATYDLNQRFNINPSMAGRKPSDISDLRVLRRTTVATVLVDRYSDETRTAAGDYAGKLAMVKNELSELYAKLDIRWTIRPDVSSSTNWFSTRIVR